MKPQFIRTDAGEDLVIISRADYDAMLARASEALDEDRIDARLAETAAADLAAGRDVAIPIDVAEAILDGATRLRAFRKWRGVTQVDLAKRAGLAQSAISAMEKGEAEGSLKAWRDLSGALNVPLAVLIDG